MRAKSGLLLIGVAALALGLAACAGAGSDTGASQEASHAAASLPGQALRMVVVFPGIAPAPSESPTALRAGVVDGEMSSAAVIATVLTDEDCAPDAEGISHCLNELRLPDGAVLTVRHPHDMRLVPCLTPGEQVELRPAA